MNAISLVIVFFLVAFFLEIICWLLTAVIMTPVSIFEGKEILFFCLGAVWSWKFFGLLCLVFGLVMLYEIRKPL
jgi:hypothetical protein